CARDAYYSIGSYYGRFDVW
nr:immunoglobulin heavy chain junction region [Macaca mulatta]MOW19632.1 immunoglobulin heavy chain junction region [Macaca mulatta]MOW19802.1 immunoglobulin heavy chain junction region [Macaca mulatta]MOW20052.1 immunoglobulin heavy chain junction region [Macaca mulatta]MOW20060.1 immunoglobulin heavy chain junction region [Macaca mulatta]